MAKLKREKRKQLLYWTDLIYTGIYLLVLVFIWLAKPLMSLGNFQVIGATWLCAWPMFGLVVFMGRAESIHYENEDIDLNNKLVDIREDLEKLQRETASRK